MLSFPHGIILKRKRAYDKESLVVAAIECFVFMQYKKDEKLFEHHYPDWMIYFENVLVNHLYYMNIPYVDERIKKLVALRLITRYQFAINCGNGIIGINNQCTPCGINEYANLAHNQCVIAIKCDPNTYANPLTKQCELCQNGYYPDSTHTNCLKYGDCLNGYYFNIYPPLFYHLAIRCPLYSNKGLFLFIFS